MTEQISLFEELYKSEQQYFADRICDEFNTIDTVYKGTFYVDKVILCKWDHMNEPDKVLEITIKSPLNNQQNRFIQFAGDKQSQLNLYNIGCLSKWIGQLEKDRDFSISVTPWDIFVFYHKFERKKIKYDC